MSRPSITTQQNRLRSGVSQSPGAAVLSFHYTGMIHQPCFQNKRRHSPDSSGIMPVSYNYSNHSITNVDPSLPKTIFEFGFDLIRAAETVAPRPAYFLLLQTDLSTQPIPSGAVVLQFDIPTSANLPAVKGKPGAATVARHYILHSHFLRSTLSNSVLFPLPLSFEYSTTTILRAAGKHRVGHVLYPKHPISPRRPYFLLTGVIFRLDSSTVKLRHWGSLREITPVFSTSEKLLFHSEVLSLKVDSFKKCSTSEHHSVSTAGLVPSHSLRPVPARHRASRNMGFPISGAAVVGRHIILHNFESALISWVLLPLPLSSAKYQFTLSYFFYPESRVDSGDFLKLWRGVSGFKGEPGRLFSGNQSKAGVILLRSGKPSGSTRYRPAFSSITQKLKKELPAVASKNAILFN